MTKPIQTDKFGDDGFAQLFAAYQLPIDEFKREITVLVRTRSVSSRAKQEGFIEHIKTIYNKEKLLSDVTNFFMAGEGFKVIQVTKKN